MLYLIYENGKDYFTLYGIATSKELAETIKAKAILKHQAQEQYVEIEEYKPNILYCPCG